MAFITTSFMLGRVLSPFVYVGIALEKSENLDSVIFDHVYTFIGRASEYPNLNYQS